MTIAVNTRNLSGNQENNLFFVDWISKMSVLYPADNFILFSEKNIQEINILPKNIHCIVIDQTVKDPLFWKLWYNYKLPAAVKKNNASVLIHTDGICSLRTSLPQIMLQTDLSFLQHPDWYPKKYSRFAKAAKAVCLKKTSSIITATQHLKEEIIRLYKIEEQKIYVIPPGISNSWKPIDWKEKEIIKLKYTEGKEYFLFSGTEHPRYNLVNLLKAFSAFKKRQKSNMQLLILAPEFLINDPYKEILRLYKYRNDVIVLSELAEAEKIKITASAYVFIRPAIVENNYAPVLQAMQCAVPVICSTGFATNEIYGEGVLYITPANVDDIADKMMLLFKDENKRNKLIEMGNLQAKKFSLETTAGLYHQCIINSIH